LELKLVKEKGSRVFWVKKNEEFLGVLKGRTNLTSSWFSKENILRVLKGETF
jgi:hypothetical protein